MLLSVPYLKRKKRIFTVPCHTCFCQHYYWHWLENLTQLNCRLLVRIFVFIFEFLKSIYGKNVKFESGPTRSSGISYQRALFTHAKMLCKKCNSPPLYPKLASWKIWNNSSWYKVLYNLQQNFKMGLNLYKDSCFWYQF